MKTAIIALCMMAAAGVCSAATTYAARLTISDVYYNESYGRWGVDIGMENPDVEVNAFQCDVAVPPSFAFTASADTYLYVFTSRVKAANELGETYATHSCAPTLRSNGTLRLVVYSAANTPFGGDSGTMMFVALTPADGSTPVAGQTFKANLTNQVLTYMDGSTVRPVYPDGVINDDALTCYDSMGNYAIWCADTIRGTGYRNNEQAYYDDWDAIANDLATNDRVVTFDLTSFCYSVNIKFAPANPNMLYIFWYENQLPSADNVVFPTDNTWSSWQCRNLVLYDYDNDADVKGLSFEQPFALDIVADRFTLNRTFPAGQWSTVVLPVTLSDAQMEALREQGVEVATLSSFDAEKAEITYAKVDRIEANTPYLVRPAVSSQLFAGLTDVPVQSTYYEKVVTAGNLTMRGNYDYCLISSTDDVQRYGYDVTTGEFVKIGRDCRLNPFRCYLELTGVPEAKAARTIAIREASDATGISEAASAADASGDRPAIYTIDGRRVMNAVPESLPAGVYIIGGKKVIIR